MRTTSLPSAYFPPALWWSSLLNYEAVIIDVHEHYIKQTIRNRCTIITANGLMNLVIPLQKYRNHTPVKDIRIDYSTKWQRVHDHAIRSAYGKSVYFEHYSYEILSLYLTKPEFLIDWNERCMQTIIRMLKLRVNVNLSEEYTADPLMSLFDDKMSGTQSDVPHYTQVFMERHGFYSGLSVLDPLFCEGPHAVNLLRHAQ